MYLETPQPVAGMGEKSWWEYLPPVALYNFVADGAAYAGEQSHHIEQAVKTADSDVIGAVVDRATKPIADGVRNGVFLLVAVGGGYLILKSYLASKAARKLLT